MRKGALMKENEKNELSDNDLEQVAGGFAEPPEVAKEETVRQTLTQGGATRVARSFRKINKVGGADSSFRGTVFRPRTKA